MGIDKIYVGHGNYVSADVVSPWMIKIRHIKGTVRAELWVEPTAIVFLKEAMRKECVLMRRQ